MLVLKVLLLYLLLLASKKPAAAFPAAAFPALVLPAAAFLDMVNGRGALCSRRWYDSCTGKGHYGGLWRGGGLGW